MDIKCRDCQMALERFTFYCEKCLAKYQKCGDCGDPCDGHYHHEKCYRTFYERELRKDGIRIIDAGYAGITFTLLMDLCDRGSKVAVDWTGIIIKSHPVQKKLLNANAMYWKREKGDSFQLVKKFWDEATWITDDVICPSLVWITSDTDKRCIINLPAYWNGKNTLAEYAVKHPIL